MSSTLHSHDLFDRLKGPLGLPDETVSLEIRLSAGSMAHIVYDVLVTDEQGGHLERTIATLGVQQLDVIKQEGAQ